MSAEHDNIGALAGEYVLGLLSDGERDSFERRLAGDAALRAAVRDARERFLELDLTAAPVSPPSDLYGRIAARLGETPPRPAAHLRQRAPRAGFWQGFATASLATGVLGAIALGLVWQNLQSPQPKVVVVLLDAQAKPGAIIEAFTDDTVRVVPLENYTIPEGRVIQVWTLPDAKTGPVSLGLMPRVQESKLSGPSLPAPKPDQLYEFTLEPEGGSPTGRPTGPILAKGFAKAPI